MPREKDDSGTPQETETWWIHRLECPDCGANTRADRMVPCFRCGTEMEYDEKIGEIEVVPRE